LQEKIDATKKKERRWGSVKKDGDGREEKEEKEIREGAEGGRKILPYSGRSETLRTKAQSGALLPY
jgi:hypothetical protein